MELLVATFYVHSYLKDTFKSITKTFKTNIYERIISVPIKKLIFRTPYLKKLIIFLNAKIVFIAEKYKVHTNSFITIVRMQN